MVELCDVPGQARASSYGETPMDMRRVVITGMGIISPLGNNVSEVERSLRSGKSGISHSPDFAEHGFASQVWGKPADVPPIPDRKLARHAAQDAVWSYHAMAQAISMARLQPDRVKNDMTGVIFGTGGPATRHVVEAADTNRETGSPRKLGPHVVPMTMSSGAVANVAVAYNIKGMNVGPVAACATSAYCIGMAADYIRFGRQDIVFAGGAEALDWTSANAFDAMGALSRKRNATPTEASRAYDADRDGFVIAGGAGVCVVESLDSALARNAPILAEIVGFGFSSDGVGMYEPSGEGAVRCMRRALTDARMQPHEIGYINTHGTSTKIGDVKEIGAIREVFGPNVPPISSTKSLSGHGLGAAGVWELIFSMIMLHGRFLARSANITSLDAAFEGFPIIAHEQGESDIDIMLSNSFGFGGTNATLIIRRYNG